jgi:nucleoredoxin
MAFEELFGSDLVHGKEALKTSTLNGKFVMIYFSAHWCGPCRAFTPSLIEFYNKLKAKRQDFELVFVSSDRDQAAFDEYYGSMPWVALPYANRDKKNELSQQFKVRGIPTLVVLDPQGKLVTANGRSEVMNDPEGTSFPWVPPTLDELIGNTFVKKGGEQVQKELKGKIFGLYFSAHWCGPCRAMTPILSKKYNELTAAGNDFEIIFVSSDRDQSSFDQYLGEMPWLAIPFSEKKRIGQLGELFEVEGIPTLVIIDKDLSTITTNGVSAVRSGLEFPFRPLPLNELTPDTASEINDSPALIVFGTPDQSDAVKKTLQPIAEEYTRDKKGIAFFYTKDHPVVASIREFAKVQEPKDHPVMVLLDIPSQRKAISAENEVNEQNVRAFLEGYLAKKLNFKGIAE